MSDGIIAPGFEPEALEILKAKKGGKYIVLQADAAFDPPAMEERTIYRTLTLTLTLALTLTLSRTLTRTRTLHRSAPSSAPSSSRAASSSPLVRRRSPRWSPPRRTWF